MAFFFLIFSLFQGFLRQGRLTNPISYFLNNAILSAMTIGQAFRFRMKTIKLTAAI